MDTIYFDFAKAFDSVPHKRLLGELKSDGINGKVLEWVKAFLSNRRQIVNVNGMPEVAKCGTYLFADDTKIFRQITTKEDALQLQSDINSLEQWSQK